MRRYTIDRYLLGRTYRPMVGVLSAMMLAFLLERLLRLMDHLSQSRRPLGYLAELAVNLVPHFLGLTLPGAFFIALFVVVTRLNGGSEIDALLASGVSLSRIAAPFVGIGVVLMLLSLLLYGFVQPYSRFGYRAVLHAAESAGWSGAIQAQAFVSPDGNLTLTADGADAAGQSLQHVFIRRVSPNGGEDVLTAGSAEIHANHDGVSVTLELHDGRQLSVTQRGERHLLSFDSFTLRVPLTGATKLLRNRGEDEGELTLFELGRRAFQRAPPAFPRQVLLAELYSRLARSVALPFLPLLALPLGLSAKRAGSAPAIMFAGLLLFSFQLSLLLGQSFAASGRALASSAVGWPLGLFVGICVMVFVTSRKRPGQNPVGWLMEQISEWIRQLLRAIGRTPKAAR